MGNRNTSIGHVAAALAVLTLSACGAEDNGQPQRSERLLGPSYTSGLGHCVSGDVVPVLEVADSTEGIAVSSRGDIYLSSGPAGKIYRRSPEGSVSVLAQIFSDRRGGMAGLAIDRNDNVYVAVPHRDASIHGVWRVRPDGSAERFASLQRFVSPQSGPNGLTFDKNGNLYVSDSPLGAVWQIPKDGGTGELWVQHELLLENPFGIPFGINGLAYRQSPPALYATITLAGRIIKIPFTRSGTAGIPEVYAESDLLLGADGNAIDVFGNIYVANIFFHTIVRVTDDRRVEVVVEDPELFKPASLVFGNMSGDRGSLFITNFERGAQPFPGEPREVADVVKVDLCVPGQPLP